MQLVNELVEKYAENYSTPFNDLLEEIQSFTINQHPESHMLSSAVQGQFLRLLSKTIRPQYILEIGTFTGFSALCLADGLAENGLLHTIEIRENDAAVAQSFFDKSSLKQKINLHIGDAKQIVKNLDIAWDIVFIDADKVSYSAYYDLTLPQLKRGGIIIADNVLFHGQVVEDEVKGKNAKAIQAFNEKIQSDSAVENVLLTIRDGLMMIVKK